MSQAPDYQSIYLKFSDVAGIIPAAAELGIAEISINTADGVLFAKKNDGTVLSFKDSTTFALAIHGHAISDITGLQTALDALTTAASNAQAGADASLKKSANLSDLSDILAARTALGVYSTAQTDTAISTAKTEAQGYTDQKLTDLIGGAAEAYATLKKLQDALANEDSAVSALTTSISNVSNRVTTLEGQNLDSRLTTAESAIVTAQAGADASLKKSSNFSDLSDPSAARTNLDVYSKSETNAAVKVAKDAADAAQTAADSANDNANGRLAKNQNLADLSDKSTARTNLEVYSKGEVDSAISGATGALASMSRQDASNVSITGGTIIGSVTFGSNAATLPTDPGMLLTSKSTIRGGTFQGF